MRIRVESHSQQERNVMYTDRYRTGELEKTASSQQSTSIPPVFYGIGTPGHLVLVHRY